MSEPGGGPRRIAVVTTSRADFGIYEPVFKALRESQTIAPVLFVSGDHVPADRDASDRDRAAQNLAERAGIALGPIVPMPIGEGDARAVGAAMGAVTAGAAAALAELRPDLLLVLGDRYEMHAVGVAASALRLPLAHIHGGEQSEGAIDNLYRHSLTKLSHLHFCATPLAARRIALMGEEAWRIHLSGAPSLDGLAEYAGSSRAELIGTLGIPDSPFVLATFHPETLGIQTTLYAFEALVAALDRLGLTTVFSRANADEAGRAINSRLEAYAREKPWIALRETLGRRTYFSAMAHAELMAGNSSSGIIEAASFGLPVVNIGIRQAGRERSANTIDAPARLPDILAAIGTARSDAFRATAKAARNVYGTGNAAETIRAVLETAPLGPDLLIKRFALESPQSDLSP